MERLRGSVDTGGPFGALAAPNISVNSASSASDPQLYTNPNDAVQTRTQLNLYRRVTERLTVQQREKTAL